MTNSNGQFQGQFIICSQVYRELFSSIHILIVRHRFFFQHMLTYLSIFILIVYLMILYFMLVGIQ